MVLVADRSTASMESICIVLRTPGSLLADTIRVKAPGEAGTLSLLRLGNALQR